MTIKRQILSVFILGVLTYTVGCAQSNQNFGEIKMKNWSLGRIDFSLTESFILLARTHSIYHVNVNTSPLNEKSAVGSWNKRLKQIEAMHLDKNNSVKVKEISSGFPVVIYKDNKSFPELVKLEAHKEVGNEILILKYEGKAEKEQNMLRLLSITSEGYKSNIPYGFNVGFGSLTSKPSINEYATASYRDKNNIEVKFTIKTAGAYLTAPPLDDIENEIKGLAQEGIKLTILKKEKKVVADFQGYEGNISLEEEPKESQFRFTWFTPGVTADSFKPEILIKAHGPLKYLKEFKATWDKILDSLKMRKSSM